jgi:para-nitrobenzyl esterase
MTIRPRASMFAILLLLTAAPAAAVSAPPPVAAVDGGSVRGAEANGVLLFSGIPFAAPPIEVLRWKAPQPVIPWKGVRDAARPAPACVQNDQGWNRADFISGREDCLTLDIGTQALGGRRPVIVWIHGGSNRAGSPGGITTSPIVGEGVVVVGIRYRLGIFGFLPHRRLAGEAGGATGNYALMDQIAALVWVRRNIARFGGDPDNVTIAGESAGSQDVALLLAAPAARPLFAKAILESGTPDFGLTPRSLVEAMRLGDQADALLGSGGDIGALRRASVPALLAADLKLHDDALVADDYMWLRPTVDGRVLPRPARQLLEDAPPKPVIIGSNRFELDLPGGPTRRDALVARSFGAREAEARAFYALDLPDPPAEPRLGTRDQQIATDISFRCPANHLADLLARRGAAIWRYEFDLAPGGGMTRHALDIGYVFGENRSATGLSLRPYWVQFAKGGDPNGKGLAPWPRYTAGERRHMAFEEGGFVTRAGLRDAICSKLEAL